MSAPLPEWIGPYRIEARIGCGGMGEVYRAYDKRLDRRVAIKLIRPEIAGHEKARERFRREARAAARLNHPAIVQIYDILELDYGDAIVMELVEGPPLADLLRDGPLEIARALRLALQIAGGMAVAHAAGIVHRDLKTENVIVTSADNAKILDFGVAKLFRRREDTEASLSLTEGVVGTLRAMSPEQAQGKRVDHRSDLFSFGTLLYEMLTGQSPFMGESVLEILTKVCTAPHTPVRTLNPDVTEPLAALVDHLLQKDAKCRPRSAQEVAAALEGIARMPAADHPPAVESSLDGEPTVVDDPRRNRPAGIPPAEKAKPRRRKRFAVHLRRWALPLAAVILLTGGLLAFLPQYRQEPQEIKYWRRQFDEQKTVDALYWLVEAEKRHGEIDAARRDLQDFLVKNPESSYAMSLRGELELGYGDPRVAAEFYAKIRSPGLNALSNLGTAYLVARQFAKAEETFRQAYESSPEEPAVVLSLADAVNLLGDDVDGASELYKKVLKLTDKSSDTEDPKLLTIRAQALARLGREAAAESAAEKALSLPAAQDNPEVWQEASLVFTLTHDYERADVYARKALDKGLGPGWFGFSWFEPLIQAKPDFAKLLKQRGGSGA